MSDDELVDVILDAHRGGSFLDLPSARPGGLSLDAAYRLAIAVEQRRIDSGDEPRGWKIGFTNRNLWDRYGVHEPIWGRVWRSSLTLLDDSHAEVSLAGLVQPRIEPEIVFGLASAAHAGMSSDELLSCVEWVAHGVEIVHTHYEGWRFGSAADTVADFGLHGRLLVGPRSAVAQWPQLSEDLAAMTMTLARAGEVVDRGHGALVLDGPVQAMQSWLQAMARTSPQWQLAAGEVVTTGTLTDAWPIAAGERWQTRPGDGRLPGLKLQFTT